MFSYKSLKRIAQHQEFSPEDFGQGSGIPIELDTGDFDKFDTKVDDGGDQMMLENRIENLEEWTQTIFETVDDYEGRINILEQWIQYLKGDRDINEEELSMLKDQVQEIAKSVKEKSDPYKTTDYSKMTDEEFYNSLGI